MASAAVAATHASGSSSVTTTTEETRTSPVNTSTTSAAVAGEETVVTGPPIGFPSTTTSTEGDSPPHVPQHLSQQQAQGPSSHPPTHPNAANINEGTARPSMMDRLETPLPTELRRILMEVARTGASTALPWNNPRRSSSSASEPTAAASIDTATTPTHSKLAALSAAASTRQPFSSRRRRPAGASGGPPQPRKKHRNGVHKSGSSRRRLDPSNNSNKSQGRKRPLLLIRTHPRTVANAIAVAAPGSVGSGRTSGSEPEDCSTQYECDSEGTSTTTNSEVSGKSHRERGMAKNVPATRPHQSSPFTAGGGTGEFAASSSSSQYKSLNEAFRMGVGLVLDQFYRQCGGYKLSPAEKRRNALLPNATTASAAANVRRDQTGVWELSSEDIFQQRRERLVTVLLASEEPNFGRRSNNNHSKIDHASPPFTIQRVAEVLVAPERYYTQTHKLCNCLEKLLLVTSSTDAFGGSRGGDTSQSRREDRELAALENEKGRLEIELRERRLRQRTASPSDEIDGQGNNLGGANRDSKGHIDAARSPSPEKHRDRHGLGSPKNGDRNDANASSQELLEAAARASLRTKFDHVGIDPHNSPDRDARANAENRGRPNSPPPPSLALSAAPQNIALQGHGGVGGFVRLPDQNQDHPSLARVPSPILFSQGEPPLHANPNMHSMLQLHHGLSLTSVPLSRAGPLDLMNLDGGNRPGSDGGDIEADHGRSSASNSDVDSESDDVSFDDSASDRSDGSDSGSTTHHEPFTAARAMALNRARLQSRGLTASSAFHPSEGFRPPADSEYQSGDSIDSMRAEDSGGSDSSSSDVAD